MNQIEKDSENPYICSAWTIYSFKRHLVAVTVGPIKF